MKKFYMIIGLFLLGTITFAQNVELSNKLIKEYENHQQKTTSKALNKSVTKSPTFNNHLWLTPLVTDVVKNWEDLTPEAKLLFKQFISRPTFASETEKITSSGNIKIHFATEGADDIKVDATDANSNNIPDYIDDVISSFAYVINLYHTTHGLTIPPGDGSAGGDAKYDIYISGKQAGEGVYGYVASETDIGNNPNSSGLTEVAAHTSFMVLRNNYTYDPNIQGDPGKLLEATIAHEYMHSVQMGYSVMDSWVAESVATWAEDIAYPGHDENLVYLQGMFPYPDVAINAENWEAAEGNDVEDFIFGNRPYAAWIFVRYMTEQTGNSIIKNIYERSIVEYTETQIESAIDSELKSNWNSSFSRILKNFFVANILMTSESSAEPYTYARADDYIAYMNNPTPYQAFRLNIEDTITYKGTDISHSSNSDGNDRLLRLSCDYIVIQPDQNFKLELTPADHTEGVELMLLKRNTTSGAFELQEAVLDANKYVVNVSDQKSFDEYYAIISRMDLLNEVADTADYTLRVTQVQSSIESLKSEFKVYPNPARDFVYISTTETPMLKVYITDLNGKTLISKQINNYDRIDVSMLKNGIYVLSLMNHGKIIRGQKLIISH